MWMTVWLLWLRIPYATWAGKVCILQQFKLTYTAMQHQVACLHETPYPQFKKQFTWWWWTGCHLPDHCHLQRPIAHSHTAPPLFRHPPGLALPPRQPPPSAHGSHLASFCLAQPCYWPLPYNSAHLQPAFDPSFLEEFGKSWKINPIGWQVRLITQVPTICDNREFFAEMRGKSWVCGAWDRWELKAAQKCENSMSTFAATEAAAGRLDQSSASVDLIIRQFLVLCFMCTVRAVYEWGMEPLLQLKTVPVPKSI